LLIRRIAAAVDSCLFMEEKLLGVPHYDNARALLLAAFEQAPTAGLVLEFGVFSGNSLNALADHTERVVYGFDSFEGLPENWRPEFPKGAFARELPLVRDNCNLVIGWFDATLRPFLAENTEAAAFLHVDCDLYSSTATIFSECRDRIKSGTVIVFDEFFNYVGWRHHEYRAFEEFIEYTGMTYKFIGVVPSHQQVAVQIL
jgi:hypothetical protein